MDIPLFCQQVRVKLIVLTEHVFLVYVLSFNRVWGMPHSGKHKYNRFFEKCFCHQIQNGIRKKMLYFQFSILNKIWVYKIFTNH